MIKPTQTSPSKFQQQGNKGEIKTNRPLILFTQVQPTQGVPLPGRVELVNGSGSDKANGKRLCSSSDSSSESEGPSSPLDDFPPPNTTCVIPRTPFKKYGGDSYFRTNTETLLDRKELSIEFQLFRVGSKINSGSFMDVYYLLDNKGINSEWILKLFNPEHLNQPVKKLKEYVKNSLENYEALLKSGLPVASIYNRETAVQDGYYIQRKVPDPIDITNDDQLKQVNAFFVYAITHDVICDLHPRNFGVQDGAVTLFDFVEDPEDGSEIFIKHALREWSEFLRKNNLESKMEIIQKDVKIGE